MKQKYDKNPWMKNMVYFYLFLLFMLYYDMYSHVAFHTWYYSLISMRLIYYFDTWAIIWHEIVPVFLKICTDLQEICIIRAQNFWCYCFWTMLGTQLTKLLRNNNKNNFALICCKFLTNFQKFWKKYDVKWWLNYSKYGSVSHSYI